MKVLVVGAGGREHALVWKLSQSPLVSQLYCAPGNGGIASLATCLPIKDTDVPALASFAHQEGIGLTVVGGEDPLAAGIVDAFAARSLPVFGPSAAAARIESDKAFAKRIMVEAGIPTARYQAFTDLQGALAYLEHCPLPTVVKACGLAKGKGVYICASRKQARQAATQIMGERIFGEAGNQVVIEEYLTGQEVSLLAFCHGEQAVLMVPSQDHKPAYDGDQGPNTGGMGCYSPVPVITPELERQTLERVILPTLARLQAEGCLYSGVLYAGLILTCEGLKTLEFNARFGDPETQVILPRLQGDLAQILLAVAQGRLADAAVSWSPQAAVCVVMASGGYPGDYEKGKLVSGLEDAARQEEVTVFHAATALKDGRYYTNGGRVLGVTATAPALPQAIERAYGAVKLISWEGAHYRTDIARKALVGRAY